jgi:hypothetical protein
MLRIVRCTTDRRHVPEIDAYVAGQVALLKAMTGNVDGFVGRADSGDRQSVVYALVTAWDGFEAMQAALGRDIVHAPLLRPVADRLRDITVEHLERMDLPLSGSGGEAAVLRIYGGPIAHRQAEAFYQHIRDRAWPEIARAGGLVSGHVGRRMGADVDYVATVTAWRSMDDLLRAFPGALDEPLVAHSDERLVEAMQIEHLEIVPPRPETG